MKTAATMAITALLATTLASGAAAQTTVLGFDDLAPGRYFSNLNVEGYVLSPAFAFSIGGGGQFPHFAPSSWLGISNSDSLGPANASYLGTPGADLLFLTRQDGLPFSLDSLTAIGVQWGLSSSAGGAFAPSGSGAVNFSGASWTNLNWLAFTAGSGDYRGFDNLALTAVPEPAAAWLLLAGLGLMAGKMRRAGRRRLGRQTA